MTKGKKTFQPLTSNDICEIYNLLHREGLISFSLTTEASQKIDALVANINGSNYEIANYRSAEEKVVAYLFFLIKNHPFVDGNKRTAVLCFLVLCRINSLETHLEGYDLDELAVFLEGVTGDDYQKAILSVAQNIFRKNS